MTSKDTPRLKWTPHQYQISAAQHALHNPGAALFLEPGL